MRLYSLRKQFKFSIFLISLFFLSLQLCFANPIEQFKTNTHSILQLVNFTQQGKLLEPSQWVQLKALIKERQSLLSQQTHVAAYYNYLLPKQVVTKLPSDLQARVEKEVESISGRLEIRAEYTKGNPDHEVIHYILKVNEHETYYMKWVEPMTLSLQTGDTLLIKKGFVITNANNEMQLLVHPEAIQIQKKIAKTEIPTAFGPQKTIVILANFQDAPTNRPWTTDQVKNVVFTDVNNIFYESSYNQTTVVGDVAGWFTINVTSNTSCNTLVDQVARLASDAATRAGINLSNYKRRIYMFPRSNSCGWAGLGTIGGGTYSEAWLNGYNVNYITGHEMGHNLGLYHSRSLSCDQSPTTGNCSRAEYGDLVCMMGYGDTAHFNAYQKDRLGWLGYGVSPPITTVTTNGVQVIEAYETKSSKPKALKILKANLSNGSKDYYYVEYRQPIGWDAHLNCTNCDYVKGVVLHQGNSANGNSSDLLDMSYTDDTKRVALLPGKSYIDKNAPNGGVTITLNSLSSTAASVNVTFGSTPPPPTCTRANPTLTITPTTTQWVVAGGKADWVLTIKNNDSSQCPSSQFRFRTKKPPVCMRPVLSKTTVTLAPGASTTVALSIATASWLDPEVYPVNITATNATVSTSTATTTASLGITASAAAKRDTCPLN